MSRSEVVQKEMGMKKRSNRTLMSAALMLISLAPAILRAQPGTLGTAFPLYVSGMDGSIFKLDSSGNQSVFISGVFEGWLALSFDSSSNLYLSTPNDCIIN